MTIKKAQELMKEIEKVKKNLKALGDLPPLKRKPMYLSVVGEQIENSKVLTAKKSQMLEDAEDELKFLKSDEMLEARFSGNYGSEPEAYSSRTEELKEIIKILGNKNGI